MTRLFGVIGHPIQHSLSPLMHQAAYQAFELDAIYAPFDVPPRHLKSMLRGLLTCGVEGLNVTVPLKETVLPLVHELGHEARALRAVNTLIIRRGRIRGENTDVAGFLRALAELGWTPRPCAALVLGAGGAARAVVWALSQQRGMELTIANRHLARAQALARWLSRARPGRNIRAMPLHRATARGYQLLINATTVGMRRQNEIDSVINLDGLAKQTVVYDLVYNRPTRLVQQARRRGCLAANGLSMLVYQGAESFRLWWHRQPPIAVMRKAVEQALNVRSAD